MTTIETLCNMIVLAVCLKGTLFGRQIVLSIHQKMDKENSPGQNFRTAPYYIKHSVLEQSKQWQIQYIAIGKTDLFNNSMGLCGNFIQLNKSSEYFDILLKKSYVLLPPFIWPLSVAWVLRNSFSGPVQLNIIVELASNGVPQIGFLNGYSSRRTWEMRYSRTSIIRTFRLSGLFLWSRFFHEY